MVEDPLPLVRQLVEYFYTGEYDGAVKESNKNQDPPTSELQFHARMFLLADKYSIEGLKVLSSRKYCARLNRISGGEEFLNSIPDVYTLGFLSRKPLVDGVVKFARNHLRRYAVEASTRAIYDQVAAEVPEFVKDVLDVYLKTPLIGSKTYALIGRSQRLSSKCDRSHPPTPSWRTLRYSTGSA